MGATSKRPLTIFTLSLTKDQYLPLFVKAEAFTVFAIEIGHGRHFDINDPTLCDLALGVQLRWEDCVVFEKLI